MKTACFRTISGLVALLVFLSAAEATTIRGRLDRRTNLGTNPAVGIAVTVFSDSAGRSYRAYTDNHGFYYLYKIPPGNYRLEIWNTTPPGVRSLRVPSIPQLDLAPIVLR